MKFHPTKQNTPNNLSVIVIGGIMCKIEFLIELINSERMIIFTKLRKIDFYYIITVFIYIYFHQILLILKALGVNQLEC